MPTYNEEETILSVLEGWYPVVEGIGESSRLVVVNDGSRDRTGQLLRAYAAEHPQLIVLEKENGGHGAAVLYGYRYAIRCGAAYIFQTDSDGQTNPAEFPSVWKLRRQYDMVLGNRRHRQDGSSRIFVTKVLKLVLLLIFGVWIEDANVPFRLMKTQTLKKCIAILPENYNLPNVMISVIFAKKKFSYRYVPISFSSRQGGVNSIRMRNIIKIGRKALVDFVRLKKKIPDVKA